MMLIPLGRSLRSHFTPLAGSGFEFASLLGSLIVALTVAGGCGRPSAASPSPGGSESSQFAQPGAKADLSLANDQKQSSEEQPQAPEEPANPKRPESHLATTEGAVNEPTANEPAATEPAATEPAATEPVTSERAATEKLDEAKRAPTAGPARPKPPPADRTPRRPGEAEKITFEDLNLGMPADVVFRPFMLSGSRAEELADTRVSIIGYMHAGQEAQRGITKFILLKNTQCKFGPGGQADHLCDVRLRDGDTTSFTTSPIKIEGTLRIDPFQGQDGNTWSVFRLDDAQIR
jgi:hypothetical protein